ncbi:hypothetical protein [Sporosarcina limicola]|uniref:Uncharacterized protein n=1 Tax=Sporosarcina limicola TaxID=34101 RepID=A0A927RCQ4_9BACL|nr:hypothetical protein [Sporosarcina limicola]MBE1552947.1 hypothetical protein [Sporosarcina limicola]
MSKNKPFFFSKVFKFVLLIVIGTLLTLILSAYGVSKWITIVAVLTLYVSVTTLWPIHIIYKSKSLRFIDNYISSNYKRPIFGYSYALAYGNKRDVEDSLKRIMNTYKQKDIQDVYGANLAIFQNDSRKLLDHANHIAGQEFKDYYQGFAYVMTGNFEKAGEFLAKLHTPWMIHALKAHLALKRGNQDEFRLEADQSINSAIGMQKYVLHHTLRRIENEEFSIV